MGNVTLKPVRWAVTRYSPGGRSFIAKFPSPSEVVVKLAVRVPRAAPAMGVVCRILRVAPRTGWPVTEFTTFPSSLQASWGRSGLTGWDCAPSWGMSSARARRPAEREFIAIFTYDKAITFMTTLTHLECSLCGKQLAAGEPRSLCGCGGILLARYDLEHAREGYSRDWLVHAPASMWRYMPLLPAANPNAIVSLGEGMTPLVRTRRLGEALGAPNLWIKDEGVNPTGSVEARGMSCAVSMALDLNIREVSIRSGGDAAAALAAYAAAAGIAATVVLPPGVRPAIYLQCRASGAQVVLSDDVSSRGEGFDLDALREPYRLEGAKTVAYELAEQSRWDLPDVVLWPAGEGLELIGAWKAFEELEAVGWISNKRPRMIAVEAGTPRTLAAGLRVSQPLGERLMLAVLDASGGTKVAVSDQEMLDSGVELARTEGIFAGLEGGGAWLPSASCQPGPVRSAPKSASPFLNPGSGQD